MMNDTTRYTGTKMGKLLLSRGIRFDWFAAQVGVSKAAVTRWANGSRTIGHAHAERAAEVLSVPFDLLFELPIGEETTPERNVA
jgi:transcriptional regulator with XRE-family HTH domain